jgi:oligopeptide/dipeptide ABC transporter ATP-binding protein
LIFITHNLGIVAKMCDKVAGHVRRRMVESGPVRQIFNRPAHPYTEALLRSIPRLTDRRERLTAIEGQPPDMTSPPSGCAFHPRCPKAIERCQEQDPPIFEVAEDQRARCWLADGR